MTTKQVSVRLAATGGKQVKAELMEVGREGERAFQQIDRGARMSGGGLQNVGFQVQDFAVQVASGTSASRALAQQLPQLLSGFGLFGVLAGTAAAVLIPLASHFLGAAEDAETLEDKLKSLEGALRDLEGASRAASQPIGDLTAAYGVYAEQAERIQQINRQIAFLDAASALSATSAALTGMYGTLERVNVEGAKTPEWLVPLEQRFGDLRPDTVMAVADALGLSEEAAVGLVEQMVTLAEADGPEAQAQALRAVIEQLEVATGGAFAMDEETRKVYQSLLDAELAAQRLAAVDIAFGVSVAADEAERLRANLLAARQQEIAAEGRVYSGRGGDPRTSNQQGEGRFTYSGPALGADNLPIVTAPPARRGGGGVRVNDDEREAARIFERTRTEAERYGAELEKLNRLQAAGYINSDTYTRALDALSDTTRRAGEAADALEQAFGEAFTSLITGASSARDAVGNLLASLAETLANQAFQQIAGGLFGGGDGGIFSGLFGGGRAGGGPVRGGVSYMVGEAGVERFTPAVDGYITPGVGLHSASTGGPVIQIDARGAQEGVAQQIAKVMEDYVPRIVRQSVAAQRAASARGY